MVVVPEPAARDEPAVKSTVFPLKVTSLLFGFVTAPVTLTVAPEVTVSGASTEVVPISIFPVLALPIRHLYVGSTAIDGHGLAG